jgi:sec-independent protein translocase protein TatA
MEPLMGLDNPLHIAFLLVILLLVFGAKRLPEMGRSLGTGLRGFKESINGEHAPDALPTVTPMTVERADEPVGDHTRTPSAA